MNTQIKHRLFAPIVFAFAGVAAISAPSPALLAQEVAAEADMEVMTRGPVHEAFAGAVSYEAAPGIIVSVRVPEAIEELPPEEQPEGDNITWIPGYWGWDDDQSNFIWISGVWRNLPPGRQWVPGYWSDLNDGRFQWTSGYWAETERKTVSYIPTAPPASIDNGPNIAAPSSSHTWIPGNWHWSETRYVWSPGYWLAFRPNWCWVPPYYSWSPSGYIHVGGYWDHAVAARGVLFAPVYYHRPVYTAAAFSFVPSVVVSLNVFSDHLFYRPHYSHYYFGDYYAPHYHDSGFYASFSWTSGHHHHGYDPVYAYSSWEHRGDPTWHRRRNEDFEYFRSHENARPARTWAAMRDARADQFNDGRNRKYANTLSDYTQKERGTRFRKIDEKRRTEMVSQSRETRKFSQDRRQFESRKAEAKSEGGKAIRREEMQRSPIKSREVNELSKRDTPPPKRMENSGKKTTQPEGRSDQEKGPKKSQASDADSPKSKPNAKGNATSDADSPKSKPNAKGNVAPDANTPKSKPNTKGNAAPAPRKESGQAKPDKKRTPEQSPQSKSKRESEKPQFRESRGAQSKSKPSGHADTSPRMAVSQGKKRSTEQASQANQSRKKHNSTESTAPKRQAKREAQPTNRFAANAPKRSKEATRPSITANQSRERRGKTNTAANTASKKRDGQTQLAANENGDRRKNK